jgi:hypothetical protein
MINIDGSNIDPAGYCVRNLSRPFRLNLPKIHPIFQRPGHHFPGQNQSFTYEHQIWHNIPIGDHSTPNGRIVMISTSLRYATLLLLTVGSGAPAQLQVPNLLGGGSGGTAAGGGLLGGLAPNVASVGAGNAAGILGYCLKNKFLGGNGATSVLGRLTGKPGMTSSPGYAEGQRGLLQTNGSNLSLGGLKSQLTSKICDSVLQHAQSFL